jgi:hypothetical protein
LSFKKLRIFALLLLLVLVAGTSFWEGMLVRGWLRPLEVVIYPINGDSNNENSDQTQSYIASLSANQFDEIGDFFRQQSQRYRLQQFPGMQIRLEPEIQASPPQTDSSAHSALSAIAWSLRLRYFALRNTPFWQNLGRIRLFIVFHAGEQGKPLQHSLGLQKGLLGVVHVFADQTQAAQNNIVIAHELLHTLGATDKYDAQGQPIFPDGFPDPDREERYPQHSAEIMAGRIAVRPDQAIIPANLAACAIGPKTAYEINW